MAKLNFYDTDAVKAFVLDILIENAELKGRRPLYSISGDIPSR